MEPHYAHRINTRANPTVGGTRRRSLRFCSQADRDAFVADHPGWFPGWGGGVTICGAKFTFSGNALVIG